jgi:hypothetical protein
MLKGVNEIFPLFSTFCVEHGERRQGESLHVLLLTDCDTVKTAAGKAVLLLRTHIEYHVHVHRETV